jgi:hypothetical protein
MKMPMIAYLYDEETGVYLNRAVEAKADPKQRGVFDIPVNATLEPPPSVADPERQIAVFQDDEWHIMRKAGVPDTGERNIKTKKAKAREETDSA